MRILRLSAENVMRLESVFIEPDGSPVVVIGGENEHGKSAVLAAIEMAIGGEKRLPPEPIRRGQKAAKVVVDLGDIIVRRTFTPSGTSLVVTNREGARYPSPQALLDGLVGKLTFDPFAFATMKPDQQGATLRALAKVDTTDLETARKTAYDERTLINRDIAQAQGALAKMPVHANVVGLLAADFRTLTAQLAAADELAHVAAEAEQAVAVALTKVKQAKENAAAAAQRVEALRAQLEAAEADDEACGMIVAVTQDAYLAATQARIDATQAVPDRAALRAQISQFETHNRQVAENLQRDRFTAEIAKQQTAADTLTEQINQLDVEKTERLAAATFPIDGLGLADDGTVTWQGLPFAQASTAIRTRVSVAIGSALNPKLKVILVRNGNDLGEKNLHLLAEAAAEAGMQCWIERIAGGNGLQTVVIEDGHVRETVSA